MDSFLTEQTTNNIFNDIDIPVIVFCEKTGRRYNTYIVGINKPDDKDYEKTILDNLKKKFGCGGAIKKIIFEGNEDTRAINIQGNFVTKTGEYLKTLNIKNLIIKEFVL
jgi:translation initiation factor 1 (eIF-1/SUI1)